MQSDRRFDGPSDLHLHSTHSDGTEAPALVMAAAHRHGLHTAALTDHDTTSGWAEAADAATSLGMTFLPGMELSARHQWRSIHLLAYLIDPDDPALRAMTERIRSSRLDRARIMADRIAQDYDLRWDDILAQTSDGATVGRPHIADALVARGVVRDRAEAFAGILSPGGDYYVALFAPDPVTAVQLITGAGGVPIMAHPPVARACCPSRSWRRCSPPGSRGSNWATARICPPPRARCAGSPTNATSSSPDRATITAWASPTSPARTPRATTWWPASSPEDPEARPSTPEGARQIGRAHV